MRPYSKSLICASTLGIITGCLALGAGAGHSSEATDEDQDLLLLTGVVRDFTAPKETKMLLISTRPFITQNLFIRNFVMMPKIKVSLTI